MFKKDINSLFTSKIMEYINKGYIIHSDTMSGSQGEQAKVDLYNGTEIIRILLTSHYHTSLSGIKLIIGRNTNRTYNRPTDIIWNNDLQIIEEYEFIKLSDNYFVTPEEYEPIKNIQKKRSHIRYSNNADYKEFDEKAKKFILSFVRRQPKCKSAKLSDIEKVYKVIDSPWNNPKEKRSKYYIKVKDKCLQIK